MAKIKVTIDDKETEVEVSDAQINTALEVEGKSIFNKDVESNLNIANQQLKVEQEKYSQLNSTFLNEKDGFIKSAYGIEKNSTENTRDYEIRAKAEFEAKKQQSSSKEGSNDKEKNELLEKINALEKHNREQLAAAEETNKQLKEQQSIKDKVNKIEKGISSIRNKYAEDKKELASLVEKGVLTELNNFEIIESFEFGGANYEDVLHDKDGKTQYGTDNKPLTLSKFLDENLKLLQGNNKDQTGTGSNGNAAKSSMQPNSLDNLSSFETADQLTTYMAKQGIRLYTEKSDKIYAEWRKLKG